MTYHNWSQPWTHEQLGQYPKAAVRLLNAGQDMYESLRLILSTTTDKGAREEAHRSIAVADAAARQRPAASVELQRARAAIGYVPHCHTDGEDCIEGEIRWDEVREMPFAMASPEHWECRALYFASPPASVEAAQEVQPVAIAEVVGWYAHTDQGVCSTVRWLLNPMPDGAYLFDAPPAASAPVVMPDEHTHAEYADGFDDGVQMGFRIFYEWVRDKEPVYGKDAKTWFERVKASHATRKDSSAAPSDGPLYADSFGYSLAMRVMQSDLYPRLDATERGECDDLIRRGQCGSMDITGGVQRTSSVAPEGER